MTISIRGARVIDPASGLDQVGDLHIEAGKIVAIGAAPAGFSAQKTLDLSLIHISEPTRLQLT
ncbi:hypothetical protein KZ855_28685, partial [Pseudomonas aeruginosa]|nr:hypothetical protein [Pseudomonas aeruginosa]